MAQVVTVHASAAETATGNSGGIPANGTSLGLSVDVTAQSGTTPTLDISVEWSPDGTNFAAPDVAADTISQYGAATGVKSKEFTVKAPFFRVVWTIAGGTPSYTFAAAAVIA